MQIQAYDPCFAADPALPDIRSHAWPEEIEALDFVFFAAAAWATVLARSMATPAM